MSLVNEALKRAEEEKLRRTSPSTEPADIPPAWEDRNTHRMPRGPKILIALAASLAVTAGWFAVSQMIVGQTPQQAAATTSETPVRPASPSHPGRSEAEISPEAQLVLAKTIDELKYYTPPARPATVKVEATSQPAIKTLAGGKDLNKKTTTPPAEQATEQKATSAAPAKPEVRKVVVRQIDRSSFKLSGIIQGNSGGGTAVVNNTFVSVGDTLNGAKVVRIRQNSVEFEIDGQRFTIGM